MAVLLLTGNITDNTMGVIWPDKSSEKIEVKSDYASRVNRLIGDILKDSGDLQAVNTKLTSWPTNSVRYDSVNKHDGYIDVYKEYITKKPGVTNNEIGLVNLPKLTIDATGTLVPNASMQILTSEHVVRETGNAPDTLKAPGLNTVVYDHVGHPIDPSSPLPSNLLMPITGTAASPVNIEINSEFFQALGFPAGISVKINPIAPYNPEFNPRFDVTIQIRATPPLIRATPPLTGRLMRQNMGGGFSWVWTGGSLKQFLDTYGGNNQKNAAFVGATDAEKDQILIVKEMGDVLQVLLYLIWYLTDLNAYRTQSPTANVEDWKAQWRKDHCMITTDSVVYYMCIDLGLSCIYTGSREGLHGSRGGITLYKYVEAAETEADITNRFNTMSAYYFNTAFTSLNNTRLQIRMMAGPGPDPDDTMRTGNIWFLATSPSPTTFINSKAFINSKDRSIRSKAADIKSALFAYAGAYYDSIVAQITSIQGALAKPGFTGDIAAYKKNVDDALDAYQRALAVAYLPYMCLSVHMALNPNKGIESPDKCPIVRLGTGLNSILDGIINPPRKAGGSITTITNAAITSPIQSGGAPPTPLEIKTQYDSIKTQYDSRSYAIDHDNDYNGVMLFVAAYDAAVHRFRSDVTNNINLELCVSVLYDELLLYIYYRNGNYEWFDEIIACAEILDNKSATALFIYLSTADLGLGLKPKTAKIRRREEEEEEEEEEDILNNVFNIRQRPREYEYEEEEEQPMNNGLFNGRFNGRFNGGKRTRILPPRPKTIINNKKISHKTRSMPKPKTRKNNKKRSHKKRSAPKRKTIKKR